MFWWPPSKGATAEECPSYETVVMSSTIQLLVAVLRVPEINIFKLWSNLLADCPHMKIGSLNVALVWQSYSIKRGSEVYMHTPTHNATYTYTHNSADTYIRSEFVQDFNLWKRHSCCIQIISLFSTVIVAGSFQVWDDTTDTTDYLAWEKFGVSLVPNRKYFRKCTERQKHSHRTLCCPFIAYLVILKLTLI